MKRFTLLSCFIFLYNSSIAQDFINGDLDGPIINSLSILPYNWLSVDQAFIYCQATFGSQASPDLSDINEPNTTISGNPYSGSTFISGLYGGNPTSLWHEGIEQLVSGFCIGCTYSVNFFQSVVKQHNFSDPSGRWGVYVDNNFIGYSVTTIDSHVVGNGNFIWEFRSLIFTATATSQTIRFLPHDDDPNIYFPSTTAGVRMGLDSIYILPISVLPITLTHFSAELNDGIVNLAWITSSEINNDFFTVEKSIDDKKWIEVLKIDGAGNSSVMNNYEAKDVNPYNGISYYRLKQNDFDGNFSYSNIEIVNNISNSFFIYPNPANSFIRINSLNNIDYTLKLYDRIGKLLIHTISDSEKTDLDLSGFLPGLYLLRISQDNMMILEEKIIIL